MRLKLRLPSDTAEASAVASAHIAAPKAAFSMRHPVKIEPSAHSRAAPVLNLEYGEYEFPIAVVAMSSSFLSVILGASSSIIANPAFKDWLVFFSVDILCGKFSIALCVAHLSEYSAIGAKQSFNG